MKQQFPDYNNCIANLANSVLKKFGVDEGRKTLHLLDSYLEKDYENIVVLLLDGMGKSIIDHNLKKDGFFQTHLAGTYRSVFPPTTVAATTSVMSGQNPCEHGWLGWDCYYPQIDKNVTVFLNKEMGTDHPAADYNVAWKFCGYESIVSKINEAGGRAYNVAPFFEPFPDSFEEICAEINNLCEISGRKYIYAYWDEPDSTMHRGGCYGQDAKQILRELEKQVQQLSDKLNNTLFVITADHGHIDSRRVTLTDYPRITECLVRMPSIEPRTLNLFVKKEKEEQFKHEFQKEFGEEFLLWTKQEVLDAHLFGTGQEHRYFRDMLGDYLAIAIDDLTIFNTGEEAEHFVSVHAGMTEDEMTIPLIVIEK